MARFEREAQVLASLNHPNIAAIYGLEEPDGMRALVMELVEGPTLGEKIGGRAMALEETLPIAKQIAEALEYAHEKGIIHRDLKPANVKLTADGHVKVLDFGLAKALEVPTPAVGNPSISPTMTISPTRVGMIMGTAGYMSPEQAAGQTVDRRADIWAFGVVIWEMLTGQRLFTGDNIAHILADVLRAPVDFEKLPAETPRVIRDLLRRCLDRDVKNRLQWIGEARIAIQNYLANPTSAPDGKQSNPSRSWLRWLWPGVAALFLLTTFGVSFIHFREAPEQTLRSAITLPENSTVHSFAISPDGRTLVIAARSTENASSGCVPWMRCRLSRCRSPRTPRIRSGRPIAATSDSSRRAS